MKDSVKCACLTVETRLVIFNPIIFKSVYRVYVCAFADSNLCFRIGNRRTLHSLEHAAVYIYCWCGNASV